MGQQIIFPFLTVCAIMVLFVQRNGYLLCLWGDEVKIRRERGICCILAILVLFSGMCLEYIKTDSLFASVKHMTSSSCISSYNGEETYCEYSTAEMSGVRNVAHVTNGMRRYSERNVIRLSLLLILASIILPKVSNMQVAVETASAPETRYITALLHYIRNQDGKK